MCFLLWSRSRKLVRKPLIWSNFSILQKGVWGGEENLWSREIKQFPKAHWSEMAEPELETFAVFTISFDQPLLWQPLLPIKLLKPVVLKLGCVSESHRGPSSFHFTELRVLYFYYLSGWLCCTLTFENCSLELYVATAFIQWLPCMLPKLYFTPWETVKEIREFLSNEELQFYWGNQDVHESFSE